MEQVVHDVLKKQGIAPGEDGLYFMAGTKTVNSPWAYSGDVVNRDCSFLHQFLFDYVLEQNFVPTRCMECWKVVVSPTDYAELRAIYSIQRRNQHRHLSKCGIEGDRINSDRLYGAYWYCDSLEEGRQRKEEIRQILLAHEIMSPPYLKRACTEYEQTLGRSDQWTIPEGQEELEKAADKLFKRPPPEMIEQTVMDQAFIINEWRRHAYRWGDKSYLQFTGGEPMFSACVTY